MIKKVSVNSIRKLKENNEKIVALTAYDYSTAMTIDEAGVDIILVGDSLAMVALGYPNTHSIGVEEMTIFTKAVAKGVKHSMVVTDMPFMSYSVSVENALQNFGMMVKNGANAVKVEGENDYILKVIERCVQAGIPVMGHLGFTPQFLNTIGGYNIQGKTAENTELILKQAKRLEDVGVFSIVIEMMPQESAKYITDNLAVPTLGIGAGKHCSGQILVSDDLFGKYSDFTPKFARKYADIKSIMHTATTQFIEDIKSEKFPSDDESFYLQEEELKRLYGDNIAITHN